MNLPPKSPPLSAVRKTIMVMVVAVMPCGSVQAGTAESLFNKGLNATATVGGTIKVPATRFPCASCHGSDGLGRREGGTRIPPITGKYLTVETSERSAYTVETFLQAVETGVNSDGRKLSVIMPEYDADEGSLRALFRYLHELDDMQRIGVTATDIAFKAPLDKETRLGFIAAMENFNRQGGSYGRTLISSREDGDYLLSADVVFERLDEKVMDAQHTLLLSQIRQDGVVKLDVISDKTTAELNDLLEPAGLSYSAAAAFLYVAAARDHDNEMLQRPAGEASERITQQVKSPEFDETSSAESLYTAKKRRIYAPVWSKGSTPRPWLDAGVDVVIAGFDEQATLWALTQGLSADAARGYALARLLFDAVLIGARDVTQSELLETIELIELQSRVFIVRSEN